ncbi:uncharacterized protein LOC144118766 [Amblyomma americanum]
MENAGGGDAPASFAAAKCTAGGERGRITTPIAPAFGVESPQPFSEKLRLLPTQASATAAAHQECRADAFETTKAAVFVKPFKPQSSCLGAGEHVLEDERPPVAGTSCCAPDSCLMGETNARQQENEPRVTLPGDTTAKGIVRKAFEDPDALTGWQMELLVDVLWSRIKADARTHERATSFCIGIIRKETKRSFLESFLGEIYELPSVIQQCTAIGTERRLQRSEIHCLSFVAQLLVAMTTGEMASQRELREISSALGVLLCSCCSEMMPSSGTQSGAMMQYIYQTLLTAGKSIDLVAPFCLDALIKSFAFRFIYEQGVPADELKMLLELIELRASGWVFGAAQMNYYHPGTTSNEGNNV